MTKTRNIISQLISQHRDLQKVMNDILILSDKEKDDSVKILAKLNEFRKKLLEHLDLEDKVFYQELLKQMEEAGQDTRKTEEFMLEMEGIASMVLNFLDKYTIAEQIQNDIPSFNKEFANIEGVLTLRIESEEVGVYSYWGLF